jgi:hypothetical protein|tara:strand:+ start:479 stop:634 length:156 start_codon:yes stop_codon:yes gene_type:complete
MKVKLNIAVGIKGVSHAKGSTVDVSNDFAAALILSNRGVAVKAKAEANKKK